MKAAAAQLDVMRPQHVQRVPGEDLPPELVVNPHTMRIMAAVLGLVGSGLLAWRVTGLLKALASAIQIHETNILSLADGGRSTGGNVPVFTGAPKHVKQAERRGLLVTGFVCMIASASIQCLLLFWS